MELFHLKLADITEARSVTTGLRLDDVTGSKLIYATRCNTLETKVRQQGKVPKTAKNRSART